MENNQKVSFELLCLFDGICRKYNIKYTLTEETLLGAVKNNGFLPSSYTCSVAMLFNDYVKFLKKSDIELQNTKYYIENCNSRNDIEEITTYLCKRSRVKLSDKRKNDLFYYDYHIRIIPLLYTSDNKSLHQSYINQFIKDMKIINNRKYAFKYYSLIKIYNRVKKYYYSRFCRDNSIRRVRESLLDLTIKTPTKYILYPLSSDNSLRSLYDDLDEIEFEGYKFYALKQRNNWLKNYYGTNCLKSNFNQPINAMLLKGPEELRRVQLVQLDILIEIDRICKKHNINYFLCSGSLLGAVRHKGFIPWDYDADVAMLQKDYDKFLEVCKTELDNKEYFARHQKTEPSIHITYTQIRKNGTSFIRMGREHNKNAHHGILVDVFPVYNAPNNFFKFIWQTKLCMFYKTMFWTHNGAKSEKKKLKGTYYNLLAKFSPLISYNGYMKCARKYENIPSRKIAWLVAKNNPYFSHFTDKQTYQQIEDIEFENYMFKTIKEKDIYLKSIYTDMYMIYPPIDSRTNGFLPSVFDAGIYHKYEDE